MEELDSTQGPQSGVREVQRRCTEVGSRSRTGPEAAAPAMPMEPLVLVPVKAPMPLLPDAANISQVRARFPNGVTRSRTSRHQKGKAAQGRWTNKRQMAA